MKFMQIAAAAALSITVLANQPSHAAAAVTATNGGTAKTTINCSQSMGWMRTTITMKPRTGATRQTVAFHQWIAPLNGQPGFWTNWTTLYAPFSSVFVANISGVNLKVYMQYAWLYNGNWTYAGEWINTYGQVQGSTTYNYSYCAV